ncbi:MAG: hypothetical protein IMW96_10085 [Thermoanaerobacteraceae bacterium]|nr:hypothetical protein [Thermoanaerobacteraceae bacterium]
MTTRNEGRKLLLGVVPLRVTPLYHRRGEWGAAPNPPKSVGKKEMGVTGEAIIHLSYPQFLLGRPA